MGSEILKGIVIVDLHVQDLAVSKPKLVQHIPQFPWRGGQVQLGVGFVVGNAIFCQIHTEYFLSQASFPLAAFAFGMRDLRRESSNQTYCRSSWLPPAPLSRRAARCCSLPVRGSAVGHL